jgi:hypothetical protein
MPAVLRERIMLASDVRSFLRYTVAIRFLCRESSFLFKNGALDDFKLFDIPHWPDLTERDKFTATYNNILTTLYSVIRTQRIASASSCRCRVVTKISKKLYDCNFDRLELDDDTINSSSSVFKGTCYAAILIYVSVLPSASLPCKTPSDFVNIFRDPSSHELVEMSIPEA